MHADGFGLKVSFDIGGVLSKYPGVFVPLVRALARGGAQVWIISDMHDRQKMIQTVRDNGLDCFDVGPECILSADYATHGEECKAVLLKEHGIDLHIDDFPGYMGGAGVSLMVWPQPVLDYYSPEWITDGSEGDFGRRRNPMKNKE